MKLDRCSGFIIVMTILIFSGWSMDINRKSERNKKDIFSWH